MGAFGYVRYHVSKSHLSVFDNDCRVAPLSSAARQSPSNHPRRRQLDPLELSPGAGPRDAASGRINRIDLMGDLGLSPRTHRAISPLQYQSLSIHPKRLGHSRQRKEGTGLHR